MSEQRRTELLDMLEDLVLEDGFRDFTMEEFAARVRCSKSTLYALGSSKEHLVTTLMKQFFRRTAAWVEEQVADPMNQRERVATYLGAVGKGMSRMSATCYEDMMLMPATRDIYELNSQAAANRVREFIEQGIATGEFRAANARFIGEAVALLIDGIQHGVLLERTGLSSGEAYADLGVLVLNTLTNEGGAR